MATPVRVPARHRPSVHSKRDGSGSGISSSGNSSSRSSSSRSSRGGKHISPLAPGVPLLLGIIYGAYAAAIARSGGAATGGQLALALISGAAFAVLFFGLVRVQHNLPRELRAGAWMLLVGGSVGFLYSLTGNSVLLSSVIGLVVGAGMFIAAFYRFYTREP